MISLRAKGRPRKRWTDAVIMLLSMKGTVFCMTLPGVRQLAIRCSVVPEGKVNGDASFN